MLCLFTSWRCSFCRSRRGELRGRVHLLLTTSSCKPVPRSLETGCKTASRCTAAPRKLLPPRPPAPPNPGDLRGHSCRGESGLETRSHCQSCFSSSSKLTRRRRGLPGGESPPRRESGEGEGRGGRALLLRGRCRRPQELVAATAGAARAESVVPGTAAGEAVPGREGGGGPASPRGSSRCARPRPLAPRALPPPPRRPPPKDAGLWGDGIPWWFTAH